MPWRSHSCAEAGQEARGRHQVAALALDRLDQHRRHLARRHGPREQHVLDVREHRESLVLAGEDRAVGVRVGDERHARHGGEEALLLGVLARGERERPHRAAVEAAQEAEEAGPPRHVARQLEGTLHGLGSGLAEEAHRGLGHRCERGDPLAEAHLALVPVVRADVEELVGGLLDLCDHVRVAVARRADGDPGREVEEAVAVDVPDFDPAAVRHHERVVARVRGRDDTGVALDDRARLGSRQLGADVRGLHGSKSDCPALRARGPGQTPATGM